MASPVKSGWTCILCTIKTTNTLQDEVLFVSAPPPGEIAECCSFRLCEIITRLVSKMNIRLITEIYTATVGCPWYTVRVRKFVNEVECKIPLRFA